MGVKNPIESEKFPEILIQSTSKILKKMKTILAPTDFSQNSQNAVRYAAALARESGARLVLFNHFYYPIQATDLPDLALQVPIDELARAAQAKLETLKLELLRDFDIPIECQVQSAGGIATDIEDIAHALPADLTVVAFSGQNPTLKALFGSISASLIRRGHLPLLVVPAGVAFQPIRRVLFACDSHFIERGLTVQPLLKLARLFAAHVEISTIQSPGEWRAVPGDLPQPSNLEEIFQDTPHSYNFDFGDHISSDIAEQALWSRADCVAMIPHHHSWLSNLLGFSTTQRVASKVSLPLLVLGERVG